VIGRIRFTFAGRPAQAILYEDGRWTSDALGMATYLSSRFPLVDVSEEDGVRGGRQLSEAAQYLHGTVELA
jgi:hypothetical protein